MSRPTRSKYDTGSNPSAEMSLRPSSENSFVGDAVLDRHPYRTETEFISQIPVLTSFVPSLEHGNPFRISVHSWESPKASQVLRSFKTDEETIAYEARIYIDGNMAAHRLFGDQSVWPEVIESTGDAEMTHPKPLRFPTFHAEILDQMHWEPGELHGRIRVVIAEGVVGPALGEKQNSTFDRLRDIIVFSFQHAPKRELSTQAALTRNDSHIDILEYSGIAWPNPRMFRKGVRMIQGNIASRVNAIPDFQAHAHSPRRQRMHDPSTALFDSTPSNLFSNYESLVGNPICEDPFVGPTPISLRQKQPKLRIASTDISMKDYNSVRTVRSHAGTDMSGVSYQKPNFERAINEAAINEIVDALSPERKHDLLQALSPCPKSLSTQLEPTGSFGMSALAEPVAGQTSLTEERDFRLTPNSEGRLGSTAVKSRGDLLSSRYASVPILTRSAANTQDRGLLQGFRTSEDPPLPNGWDRTTSKRCDSALASHKSLLELRSRSISNASKRKRQYSPSTDPLLITGSFQVPSMSTSPCKLHTATPSRSNNESLAEVSEGGVLLFKEE